MKTFMGYTEKSIYGIMFNGLYCGSTDLEIKISQ
jgi:hypothetical protein